MSTLKATTLEATTLLHSDGTSTTEPSIPALDQRMAKAWCQWDMSTLTVKGSYNISSITDGGVGDQYPNFATAMADSNYAAVANGNAMLNWHGTETTVISTATTSCRVIHRENNAGYDSTVALLIVFGN